MFGFRIVKQIERGHVWFQVISTAPVHLNNSGRWKGWFEYRPGGVVMWCSDGVYWEAR